MAEIKLTKAQQSVVDARDCSLLVAAAAGSGKTAVLVQRIVNKILDGEKPQEIDRLLIVTFTNAAAAEMRERIGAALEKAWKEHPESVHLERQLMLLHSAQITTIHSFCLSVIREHFHLLSLDPGFRIADETELSLLEEDVLEEVLEESYQIAEKNFLELTECYGTARSDKTLSDYVRRLYHFAESSSWPEEWLEELSVRLSGFEEGKTTEPPLVRRMAKETLGDCRKLLVAAAETVQGKTGLESYRNCFLQDMELLDQLLFSCNGDFEQLSESIRAAKFPAIPRISSKSDYDEAAKEAAKAIRDTAKELLDKLKKELFFASLEEQCSELSLTAGPIKALIQLTMRFMERFSEKKREKNLLDFSDLEHLALRVLVTKEQGSTVPTAAARALAKRYDEIMIDEYQDSNQIQEDILLSISGEPSGTPNLFMVGDVKQSIYRFRMANPKLFMKKYETYTEDALKGTPGADLTHRKIDLRNNFRSRQSVLSSTNVVFAGLMHKESAEIAYDENAALYYTAGYPEDTREQETEVLFVSVEGKQEERQEETPEENVTEEVSESSEGELAEEERTAVAAEALAVAGRIRALCESGMLVRDKSGMRPLEYSDIVILLRTVSGWSETFLQVLTEQGIPAYADTQTGYFRAVEVQKTMNVLRILDNPRQDIPFASVLHSPIAGLTAEELAKLRVRFGTVTAAQEETPMQCSLYDAARRMAEQPESETETKLREKLVRFFTMYDRLHAASAYVSTHELLERFYEESGYYDLVSVMPGGERRSGNLSMLVAKAKAYEATSYTGLCDFVRYMDKMQRYEVDFGEAKAEETGKLVRIMSIHKSKGLEFPVVFVSGMEKQFNRMDMRSRLIFHPEYGIGADYVNRELRYKSPTILKKALARLLSEEMIAEELRILYVAMTRAKEKLILTGTLRHPQERYRQWRQRGQTSPRGELLSTYLHQAVSYFDFLGPLLFQEAEEPSEEPQECCLTQIIGTQSMTGRFLLKECRELTQTAGLLRRQEETERQQEVLKAIESCDGETTALTALLKRRETFIYPHRQEAGLPMKVSISELKHRKWLEEETVEAPVQLPGLPVQETEAEEQYPAFLRPEQKISGSERGTIYHRVMELLPFTEGDTQETVMAALAGLVESGRLSEQECQAVNPEKIGKFLRSGIGKRMQRAANSGKLYREQPFVLGLPAKEVDPASASEQSVLLQGIIDAFFVEEDAVILLDYKTDYVQSDAREELTKKYREQLRYYRRALEQIYGLPVRETWIYSFFAEYAFSV